MMNKTDIMKQLIAEYLAAPVMVFWFSWITCYDLVITIAADNGLYLSSQQEKELVRWMIEEL